MDSHSGLRLAGSLDRLMDMMAIHPHAAELWQKGGMKVYHPVVIFTDQKIRNDQQEAGKDDEVD